MLNFLKRLFFPTYYSFDIVDTDFENNFVTVEDKSLGIKREIGWGHKKLKRCDIIGEYEVLFTYTDGTKNTAKILE